MTISDMADAVENGGWIGVIIVLLTLVQISPIKLDPWTVIGKAVGKVLNQGVTDKIDCLQKKIDEISEEVESIKGQSEQDKIVLCRIRILRFNAEIVEGRKMTKEYFDQTLDDISSYKSYVACHPEFKNEKAVLSIKNIERVYQDCLKANSFL